MPKDLAAAAREVLALEGDLGTAEQAAAAAAVALGKLTSRLACVVGELGIRTILGRSVILSSKGFPWLGGTDAAAGQGDLEALRRAFAAQPPAVIGDAFVRLLTTFVEVLGRLIGHGLVTCFLAEVWPSIFPFRAPEGTP